MSTQLHQVDRLLDAREAEPDLGFMTRLMTLCSLPRTDPGTRTYYKRVNGPYKLFMNAGMDNKLPYGSLPRLLLAWMCTEAVRTQSSDLVLGRSLSEFMGKLGMTSLGAGRTRLRNQMTRLFNSTVRLSYENENGEAMMGSMVASRAALWWNAKRLDEPALWESTVRLGEELFQEIIRHPVPIEMNTLKALKRSPLGLDLYLWLRPIAYFHSSSRYASPGSSSTCSSEQTRLKRMTNSLSAIFARSAYGSCRRFSWPGRR